MSSVSSIIPDHLQALLEAQVPSSTAKLELMDISTLKMHAMMYALMATMETEIRACVNVAMKHAPSAMGQLEPLVTNATKPWPTLQQKPLVTR